MADILCDRKSKEIEEDRNRKGKALHFEKQLKKLIWYQSQLVSSSNLKRNNSMQKKKKHRKMYADQVPPKGEC